MKLPIISYIDFFSHVLPIGTGLFHRTALLQKERFIFFVFVCLAMITEIVTLCMAMEKMNNLWVLHIHHLLEFGLLMQIISMWQRQPLFRKIWLISIPFFIIFWIISNLTIESFFGPAEYSHVVFSGVLVFASIYSLINLMKDESLILWKEIRFWITSGILIYFGGNTVLFLFFDKIFALKTQDAITVWNIHWIIDTIVNVFYAIGFLCLG